MGIAMGTTSYADYLASEGIETFLIDLRGYGLSTPIDEQLYKDVSEIKTRTTMISFEDDILACCNWVRSQFENDIELTVMGFSMQALSLVIFNSKYPNVFDKIVSLSPAWKSSNSNSFATPNDTLCLEVSMNSISDRLEQAQLPGKDFREPLWFEQAFETLKTHRTFNVEDSSWLIVRLLDYPAYVRDNVENVKKTTDCEILWLASEFDVEFPSDVVEDFYHTVNAKKSTFRIIPDATHLVIWEKNRKLLYEWTAEFVNNQWS
jgi:alpha-beta hydrolase superfamily lysophospholipase